MPSVMEILSNLRKKEASGVLLKAIKSAVMT
jgi:hypothetical protein